MARANVLIRSERKQRREAREVDREVGSGIPFAHLPPLKVVEPANETIPPGRALLAAQPAGAGEGRRCVERAG
jgi:hypothetical protein